MKPTNIEGRFHGDFAKTAITTKLLERFGKSIADKITERSTDIKEKTVKAIGKKKKPTSELETTRKSKGARSKSKKTTSMSKKQVPSTKKKSSAIKTNKTHLQQDDDEATEIALKEITRQIEIHQKAATDKQIAELKSKLEQRSQDLLNITRDRNSCQLSYDTDRIRLKQDRCKLNYDIIAVCTTNGNLEVDIKDLTTRVNDIRREVDDLSKGCELKSIEFDRLNIANVQLDEAMIKIGMPGIEVYDKDHYAQSRSRISLMIDGEIKTSEKLKIKIDENKSKKLNFEKKTRTLENEIFEVSY